MGLTSYKTCVYLIISIQFYSLMDTVQMQTFLPYASFTDTARVLDNKRLGKQRVENLQIMKALQSPSYRWNAHPAVNMWRGYAWALLMYQTNICEEWVVVRKYKDTCLHKTIEIYNEMPNYLKKIGDMPPWINDFEFHHSHKSNLTRKNSAHYSAFWDVPEILPYKWPIGIPIDNLT